MATGLRGNRLFLTVLSCLGLSAATVAASGNALPLLEAVKQGDAVAVQALLRSGVDVNVRSEDDATPLHLAVARDDEEVAGALIEAGADVNAVTPYGITPLFLASSRAKVSIVQSLLRAHANPNAANATGVTPLMMASRVGDIASVQALLAQGADVNAKEQTREQTALMWALAHRRFDLVPVLIAAGADIEARSLAWSSTVLGCCKMYEEDGRGAMPADFGGYTPLMYAAQQGDIGSAQRLLAAGAKLEATAADGSTPLLIAAYAGRSDLALWLLEQGANLHADGSGFTALHAAVLRNDVTLVQALLSRGANPNVRLTKPTMSRSSAFSPYRLEHKTRAEQQEILSQGEDPSVYAFHRTWVGATPFWLAAAWHDMDLMKILLAAGADVDTPRLDGVTPLIGAIGAKKPMDWDLEHRRVVFHGCCMLAIRAEDEEQVALETVTFLVEAGADVNAVNDEGDTALHRAAAKIYPTIVKFLAEHGARLDIRNKAGLTPLGVGRISFKVPPGPLDTDIQLEVIAKLEEGRAPMVALLQSLGAKE